MALERYLAMTAAEIAANSTLPAGLGYMACHFSPCSLGLSNCPWVLPEGTLLILDDSAPMQGHDPGLIVKQLSELVNRHRCGGVLLDFQRPGQEKAAVLAAEVVKALPCPVGVSELYAAGLACPVFLPPVPLDVPLKNHLAPWRGREIWLDIAPDGAEITVGKDGYRYTPLPPVAPPENAHREESLHCRYRAELSDDRVKFTLYRTREDLDALLADAEQLGVSTAVGLWQELK